MDEAEEPPPPCGVTCLFGICLIRCHCPKIVSIFLTHFEPIKIQAHSYFHRKTISMKTNHIVIWLFSNVLTCFFTCLVHMLSTQNSQNRHCKPEIKALATIQNETLSERALRYDRSLETGFRDRISVYLFVAAAAANVNRSVYVWWHACNQDSNHHAELCLDEVQLRITWPSNLHVLSRDDFYSKIQNLSNITYNTPGLLMSHLTFDGVYTTAWKTMRLPSEFPQLHEDTFEKCYKDVCRQLRLEDTEQYRLPHAVYIVLHIRGGDKKTNTNEFNTKLVLQQMPSGKIILVITDDNAYASHILSEYSHNLRTNNSSYLQIMPKIEQSDGRDETLFRDFHTLLQAENYSTFTHCMVSIFEYCLDDTYDPSPEHLETYAPK